MFYSDMKEFRVLSKEMESLNYLQMMHVAMIKTKVTKKWSNMELHRTLQRNRCFEVVL